MHGTIVVVVSTKDGFVLAGDSQGTGANCQALPGEYEKVFSFGKRSGIVVAGLIGFSLERDVASSLATVLHTHDQQYKDVTRQPNATGAANAFVWGIRDMMTLLDDSYVPGPLLAEASAVSISDQGSPQWVTFFLAPKRWKITPSVEVWGFKVDHFEDPPASQVIALGSGKPVVDAIINNGDPDGPNEDVGVKRYFQLKLDRRLAELSLNDGEQLARFLVNSAISFAHAHPAVCYGIGGDIQMLTITRQGPDWVQPLDQAKLAAAVSPFHVRILNSPMVGRLDGAQWIRTTVPADAFLTFDGDADALVTQAKFDGKCTFTFGAKAEEKMPETAARLRSTLAPHCDVYRQTKLAPIKLSEAPTVNNVPSPPNEIDEYGSLCDLALKSKEKELNTRLRAFGKERSSADQEANLGWSPPPGEEEFSLFTFKHALLDLDRWMSFDDEYQRKFVPPAVAIRRELMRRVTVPTEINRSDTGVPYLRWNQLADELDTLGDSLPGSECKANQKAAKN